jgi:hypothetical protein
MPSDDVNGPQQESEIKLSVGWQKLTKQELIEALTVALVEKIRSVEAQPRSGAIILPASADSTV